MADNNIAVDKKIEKFISRHHILTLATVGEDGAPYCATLFYSYDPERAAFIFTSSHETLHAQHLLRGGRVAANIALETRVVGRIKGLQITGEVFDGDSADRDSYISAFPFAAVAPLTLWRLEPDFMKLTDNTLGFGKKLIWNR